MVSSSSSGPVTRGLIAALAMGPTRLMSAWECLDMAKCGNYPGDERGWLYSACGGGVGREVSSIYGNMWM